MENVRIGLVWTAGYTVKNGYRLSRLQPGCHLPGRARRGIIYLFPARESLVSDIPSGDGKTTNLFLQCTSSTCLMSGPNLMNHVGSVSSWWYQEGFWLVNKKYQERILIGWQMFQDFVQSVIEASKDPSYLVSNCARKDSVRLRNGDKKDSHWSLC